MVTTRSARLAAVALVALLSLAGCSDVAGQSTDASPAQGDVSGQSLDADAFADLASTADVVVLDVRTPDEFAEGHLEGAVNMDVSSPDFTAGLAELDPSSTYAVYCRSGNRSQVALQQMQGAGIEAVADLAGGIQAWVASGRDVVPEP